MKLKGDPNAKLKATLKKYKITDMLDEVLENLDMYRGKPSDFKKSYIMSHSLNDQGVSTVDEFQINLKDPTTWGDMSDEDVKAMPSDEAFLEIAKACIADRKRNEKRDSYEF